jgi:hypothetical protein
MDAEACPGGKGKACQPYPPTGGEGWAKGDHSVAKIPRERKSLPADMLATPY